MNHTISEIIDQHANDAAFLWFLRDGAVYASNYDLQALTDLDDRLEAHLDGLRIAGEAGWLICKQALNYEEAGEVFAASILAFESGIEVRIQTVIEAVSAFPELSRGLASALGWLPYPRVKRHMQLLLTAEPPDLRRIGITACAVHRHDPGCALLDAISSDDPLLRARTLRAVGELARVDLQPLLLRHYATDDVLCRFSAAWSAVLLGDMGAIPTLQAIVGLDAPFKEEAVKMALRRMSLTAAHAWQQDLARNPDTARLAVIGAGVMGDPVSIPWLIEQMTIPTLARVAGEAFTMITGVDIAYEDLEGEWPENFEAGPTEDPEDENVDMDPDEDLPWPAPERVAKWWHAHRSAFQSGTRYLLGKPMNPEWLQDVLRNGMQRQRAAAALELAMHQPGQPLFEVRAPGFRQRQLLRIHGQQG
jgi:uncharacterized protein (TIGR02270 family)